MSSSTRHASDLLNQRNRSPTLTREHAPVCCPPHLKSGKMLSERVELLNGGARLCCHCHRICVHTIKNLNLYFKKEDHTIISFLIIEKKGILFFSSSSFDHLLLFQRNFRCNIKVKPLKERKRETLSFNQRLFFFFTRAVSPILSRRVTPKTGAGVSADPPPDIKINTKSP